MHRIRQQNRRACFLISEFLHLLVQDDACALRLVYTKSPHWILHLLVLSRPGQVLQQRFQVRLQSHVGIHPSIASRPCYLQGIALSLLVVFLHFQLDLTISLQVRHQRCAPLHIHFFRNNMQILP